MTGKRPAGRRPPSVCWALRDTAGELRGARTYDAVGHFAVTTSEECESWPLRSPFWEPTRAANKDFLFKRIARRIQSLAEGDLSERARRRAEALARDADLRTTAQRTPPTTTGGRVTQQTYAFDTRCGAM